MAEEKSWTDARIQDFDTLVGKGPYMWRVVDEKGVHDFRRDQYEMRVTFTKRLRPFKAGDRARPVHGRIGVIDAVSSTYGEQECWFRHSEGSHTTYYASALELVDEDDD